MNKVSIIVPIYNKEKGIKRCLRSIINQTYQNLEIILINDGSTDKSLEICVQYAKKDKRIKVFSKINEGVDLARHVGIKKCTGDYVTFVDSDDSLTKNAIELLVKALEKTNSDISCGNVVRTIGRFHLIKKKVVNFSEEKIITHDEFISEYLKSFCGWGKMPISMWAKLYKKSLIMNITPTKLKYGEDLCFNLQVMPNTSKFVQITNYIYEYSWGGVTSYVDDNKLFGDALKQYEYKTQIFCKFKKNEFIEMANVELCNFFITYVDCIIEKYKKEEWEEKILFFIKNQVLQNAVRNVSFKWFKESEKFNAIKNKDIKKLILLRKDLVKKRKIKKNLFKLLSHFI